MRYYCKCGLYFGKASWLQEHIGICNPHWPRSSPEDEHGRVTEEEWLEALTKHIREYAIC